MNEQTCILVGGKGSGARGRGFVSLVIIIPRKFQKSLYLSCVYHVLTTLPSHITIRTLYALLTSIPHIMSEEIRASNDDKETAPSAPPDPLISKPLPRLPSPDLNKPLPPLPTDESDASISWLGLHRVSCSLRMGW